MREAVRLRASGLKPDDIARCLQLTAGAVRGLLYEHDHGEPKHPTAAPGRRHPPMKDET